MGQISARRIWIAAIQERDSKLDKHDDGGGEEEEIFMGFGIVGVRYGNCVNV